jgi:hypothetical protein
MLGITPNEFGFFAMGIIAVVCGVALLLRFLGGEPDPNDRHDFIDD